MALLNLMANDGGYALELSYYCTVKVHGLICLELKKFIVRISQIFPGIESARPGCKPGIQALCLLHDAMDKAKSIIQECSESSKLYLAITADKVVKRCERIRDALDSCLSQIQNLVPVLLAAKISGIIHDLRSAKFPLISAEDEARGALLVLLRRDINASSTVNNEELEILLLAASKLNITSPVALLIEKRSIKRLLDKVNDTEIKKTKILKYLLYLLRKYTGFINEGTFSQQEGGCSEVTEPELQFEYVRDESQAAEFGGTPQPPDAFKCPFSMSLMYDPVIIASGKTFERIWIERWFNEGNETCPVTHKKLDHLTVTPNSVMKDLISQWCMKCGITVPEPCSQPFPAPHSSPRILRSGSISSFGSYMNDLRLQVSHVSLRSSDSSRGSPLLDDKVGGGSKSGLVQMDAESQNIQCCSFGRENTNAFLSRLEELSWESQCRVVENVKKQLEVEDNHDSDVPTIGNDQIMLLVKFMKNASEISDAKAHRDGVEVLWAILCRNRREIPPFHEDVIHVLAPYLGSEIAEKVLEIMEVLSREKYFKSVMLASGTLPSILEALETRIRKLHSLALKVVCNLSTHNDTGYHMVYLDCIPKLVQLLGDRTLALYSIKILKNLSQNGEARIAVAESIECLDAIDRLLENGTKVEQENAVDVLLYLCHGCPEYIQLVKRESIIESLASIYANGNSRGKEISRELIQLLDTITDDNTSHCQIANAEIPSGSAKKSSTKAFRFLAKKMPVFSKPFS
ncbi:U-box domain-containing protein 5 isoform X1 [Ziziphus jujuba]|uniref:RING-type E3 ubiquitin transferase n=2 Tax=Ziziphus jujuba TaxID=326968 RepID=A0ABM3IMS8_ZIZJJ|nr:U-box domain-containing protein 5 isoform X1 [Ziziphus jujuba]XP_015884653.2 U-box domain-containing protein 5 isoform X1 [Ziziphus jujuba]XP_048331836.1 U-box domain-containing protein 5 isoform X1 [Ziziphus jujuba]XP_048331838.1 U-box domain-containing protein 5 isoform X1 [Ziziphus jujuba]KAH7524101.1 hypothetical protein FEM48_Zijuj06G0083300 [Ziziphus jujuba var. spinosa]